MAVMARRSGGVRLRGVLRGSTLLMLAGLVLALAAGVLVFGLVQRTQAAARAARRVPQTFVVMATREISESSPIPADAVTVKPFPTAYLPQGAATRPDQVVGKFAAARLTRDQIVLTTQVADTRRGSHLSEAIPPGKMGVWFPLPELFAQAGGLRPGDRVDVLLSLPVPAAAAQSGQPNEVLTTQTTLQNVEVFYIGEVGDGPAPAATAKTPTKSGSAAQAAQPSAQDAAQQALFLIDPQDAVLAKFIKDSGGTYDFVLRARDWTDPVQTAAVSAQSVIDQYRFRTP